MAGLLVLRSPFRPLILGLIAAVLAFYGYRTLFPDDERQIRDQLDRVATALSVSGEESDVGRLARIAALSSDLAIDVRVEGTTPGEPLKGRDAVMAAAVRVAAAIGDLRLAFLDTEVGFEDGRQQALVHLTAEARFKAAGESGIDARELDIIFRKTGGRWLVATVLPVDTLTPVR